jgi:hypothetical protein
MAHDLELAFGFKSNRHRCRCCHGGIPIMSKDQTLTLGSPFKFGFFAGLGFFFASILASIVTIAVVVAFGVGTVGALLSAGSKKSDPAPTPVVQARPAGATLAPVRTHRSTGTERASVDDGQ